MKKCIFYLPYKLDKNAASARMLRPRKMIQAFQDIGYDVFVISGVSCERRKLIRTVKHTIRNGEKYDFMYTESHTEPTLLTDPNHLPTHPFLDYGFYRFVKKHGIKIGLFYCDIYWKFDTYGKNLPAWKRRSALLFYRYDIWEYKRLLSRFYVPDMKICSYVGEDKLTRIASELLPGADCVIPKSLQKFEKGRLLKVFYVGGLGNHYQIIELVKAVALVEGSELTVCCRDAEWDKEKNQFEPYLCDRIHIIHKNGDQLEEYYHNADICSLLFQNDTYMNLAKPFKTFEYLAHEKPILSTKGTAIGLFVENYNIGWNIEFNADVIADTLKYIINNPSVLEEKKQNCVKAKEENLWTCRAKQVVMDLYGECV